MAIELFDRNNVNCSIFKQTLKPFTMKKLTLYVILMSILFVSCKNEKQLKNESKSMTIGALTIANEHPVPGDSLDITYQNAEETEAWFVYLVGSKNYPMDIDFKSENSIYRSSIKVPDSAVALAFIFKNDQKFDNNNKEGYFIPLYNDDKKQIPGSKSAMYNYAKYSGADYGIYKESDSLLAAMKADLEAYPELKSEWEEPYYNLAYKQNKDEGLILINTYLESLSQKDEKTEKDYTSMMGYYSLIEQQEASDSIKTLVLEKFPKGATANFEMVNDFQPKTDLKEKVVIFNNYSKNNPELGNIGNYMASSIARSYYQQKDMENFEKFTDMIDDENLRASTLNNLAWELAEKGENIPVAKKMSKKSLDLLASIQKNPDNKPDYLTERQYKKSLESSYSMFADTYALIMFKQGKVKQAIAYQEKAHDPKARDAEANERFISYLMADNQYEEVTKKAEKFIELGYGNDKIKDAYKTAYFKTNPDSKDVDGKLTSMAVTAEKNAMADIKKSMIDEDAPKFTLKDLDGNDVSLESFKGKTVILDFWATWCGPCKASFPGMQQVVTKYKDDDKVALLFVDTFESGKDREKNVEDFIKKNKYTFHVVYDSEDSTIAEKYGITGIPTKIVVGPDGNIKFKSVGYSGSIDKLMKEMEIMIELSKS